MDKHLCLKCQRRQVVCNENDQYGKNETQQSDHLASLGNSIACPYRKSNSGILECSPRRIGRRMVNADKVFGTHKWSTACTRVYRLLMSQNPQKFILMIFSAFLLNLAGQSSPTERRWLASVLIIFLVTLTTPTATQAGECPTSAAEIATDRPDVTNSSLVVPVGSLQIENGINTTGQGFEKTFDGTNSRLRLGIAPCLEILVDLPNYVGRLKGDSPSGFANIVPAVKWQFDSLPAQWNLSITAGAGLPAGSSK